MRSYRRMASLVAAISIPLGLFACLTLSGGAWASSHAAGKGTVSCNSLTGSITFNPPLVPGASTAKGGKETTSISTTLGGCTANGSSVAVTSNKIKPIKSKAGNSCSTFTSTLGSLKISEKISWSGVSPTTVSITSTSLTGTGFTATGKAKGSYPGPATISVTVAPSDIGNLTKCIGMSGNGVSSLSITAGSYSS